MSKFGRFGSIRIVRFSWQWKENELHVCLPMAKLSLCSGLKCHTRLQIECNKWNFIQTWSNQLKPSISDRDEKQFFYQKVRKFYTHITTGTQTTKRRDERWNTDRLVLRMENVVWGKGRANFYNYWIRLASKVIEPKEKKKQNKTKNK